MTRAALRRSNRSGRTGLQGVAWLNPGLEDGGCSPAVACSSESGHRRGYGGAVSVERLRHGGYGLTRGLRKRY